MKKCSVVVVGGGPVGLALGIELGLLGIETIIIEKYADSLLLPKAQLLNPRSMEFFRRWGIHRQLIARKLLPDNYPLHAIWCNGLAGKVYAQVDFAANISADLSSENYLRIPLWITESVLRERVNHFSCVSLLKPCEVIQIEQHTDYVEVTAVNRTTKAEFSIAADYLVGCDGANSFVRASIGVEMQIESPMQRMLNVLFTSRQLTEQMTVPKGILYYNLSLDKPASIGCVDYTNHLWYGLMMQSEQSTTIEIEATLGLEKIAGFTFDKTIHYVNEWLMRAEVAQKYRVNRILLAGDAAHVLPPTGGHGLNTGLGDVVNLGWKLAAVIKDKVDERLLDSYEMERRPVALCNLAASKKNAYDARQVRELYPPETRPNEFSYENERLAKQHAISLGIALGYCYTDSPIIFNADKNSEFDPSLYHPKARPGFFAPHFQVSAEKIFYDGLQLSYTLLINAGTTEARIATIKQAFLARHLSLIVFNLSYDNAKKLYDQNYYLLRPDWHIAWCGAELPTDLDTFIDLLLYGQKINTTKISG